MGSNLDRVPADLECQGIEELGGKSWQFCCGSKQMTRIIGFVQLFCTIFVLRILMKKNFKNDKSQKSLDMRYVIVRVNLIGDGKE